jgi:hypothetical protein
LIFAAGRVYARSMTEQTPPETKNASADARTDAETENAPVAVIADANDVPPDRLAIDQASPHFDEDKLRRGIGIRFKGVQRHNVEEYSISEGWVRVQAGKAIDRRGKPLTLKLNGPVEAWFEDLGDDAPVAKRS